MGRDKPLSRAKRASRLALACRDYYDSRLSGERVTAEIIRQRCAAVWLSDSPFGQELAADPRWTVSPLSETDLNSTRRMRYHAFDLPEGRGPWNVVRKLALRPILQRLNYCKQLSTTNILFDIEATHNRLSHALGTIDICSTMLQAACKTADEEVLPSKPGAAAILLYAMVHDMYHGPFGHSFDIIGDLVVATGHARIDKDLLEEQIQLLGNRQGDLSDLVAYVAEEIHRGKEPWDLRTFEGKSGQKTAEEMEDEIADWLWDLSNREEMVLKRPKQFWLRELVDSSLDSDRIDYLFRDTYYLHVHKELFWMKERLNRMLRSIRIAPSKINVLSPTMTEQATSVHRVHWDLNFKAEIERALALRSELYKDVYECPAKRSFDEMLTHALVWILRTEVCKGSRNVDAGDDVSQPKAQPESKGPKTFSDTGLSKEATEVRQMLRSLTRVTDDELFHLLYEVGTAPEHALPLALVHDVASGRPFESVWRLAIPLASLQDAKKRALDLAAEWSGCERSYRAAMEGARSPVRHKDAAKELVTNVHKSIRINDMKELCALAYWMEWEFGQSFTGRENTEKLLWQRIIDGNGNPQVKGLVGSIIDELHRKLCWPRASDNEMESVLDALHRYPLLFVSVPWVSPPGGRQQENGVPFELINWELEDVPVFHRDGKPVVDEGP